MKTSISAVLAGVLLASAATLNAATTIYNDDAAWKSAVNDIYTTEAFEDATLNEGLSVVTDEGYVDTTNEWWHDRVTPEGHTTTWSFDTPVTSFGGNWDLAGPGGQGTSILAVVIDGVEVEVGQIQNTYAGEFWGFVSDEPFSAVLLKSGNTAGVAETYNFDNMVYTQKLSVSVDIKPGSCPNPVNLKSQGVLPVAILGTPDFDVTQIDPLTITLSREGVEGEVAPIRSAHEDVGTPFVGEACGCHDLNGDGIMDLTLKFNTQEVVTALELDTVGGETVALTVSGALETNGLTIEGADCVLVLDKGNK